MDPQKFLKRPERIPGLPKESTNGGNRLAPMKCRILWRIVCPLTATKSLIP